MPITPTHKIWMNGQLVDWEDAKIHILTHTLHYGTGVFEGIRAYETSRGPAVFRLTEHIVRLHNSAKIMMMDMPYSVDELVAATKATVKATGLPSCYVRPIAYYGYGEMGLNTLPCSVDVAIACWPWGAYLGDDAVEKGVRMKISSWTRHDHNTMPPASKTTGNYVNSSLAKVEALKAGYDEAIMLNPQGLVSECTGENIFVRAQRPHHHAAACRRARSKASRRRASSPSPATSATRSSSVTSRAATSTSPKRSSCAARRPRSRRSTRSTTATFRARAPSPSRLPTFTRRRSGAR